MNQPPFKITLDPTNRVQRYALFEVVRHIENNFSEFDVSMNLPSQLRRLANDLHIADEEFRRSVISGLIQLAPLKDLKFKITTQTGKYNARLQVYYGKIVKDVKHGDSTFDFESELVGKFSVGFGCLQSIELVESD